MRRILILIIGLFLLKILYEDKIKEFLLNIFSINILTIIALGLIIYSLISLQAKPEPRRIL